MDTPIVEVELCLIDPHPRQPRLEFSKDSISQLAENINDPDVGLMQPILVRRKPTDPQRYELIAGERRVRAARKAAWSSIPAVIRDVDDRTSLKMMMTENYQREQLNALEFAFGIAELNRPEEEGGCGMTAEEIGRMFHHHVSWVSHRLRLLKVPEPWRSQLISGDVVETKALLLVGEGKDKELHEAVRLDQEQHPDRWRTREQWEFHISKIMASIKRGRASVDAKQPRGQTPGQACDVPLHSSQSQPINRARTPNKAGNNAKRSIRSVHGQTDMTLSSNEPPNIDDSVPSLSRMLTDDQVQDMLQPYAKSRADLVSIRDHCQHLLKELAANRPSQRRYMGRTKRGLELASA